MPFRSRCLLCWTFRYWDRYLMFDSDSVPQVITEISKEIS